MTMARNGSLKRSPKPQKPSYILDEQIGFILRQVWQRHATIFAREIGINLTSAQWAALSKLAETGPCSQNLLGRLTAMDVATIKGVIDRLTARGLTETSPDPEDGRRLLVSLTRAGQQLVEKAARCQGARDIGGAAEQAALIDYLTLMVIFSDTTGGLNG
jgi:MarR family transcriptional regulator, lower aerobic nicotinate degradation pathway regulator